MIILQLMFAAARKTVNVIVQNVVGANMTVNIVRQSNYKDERKCPVCKKIVKPSCKGHPNIPYAVYRMIEIKLNLKKRKYTIFNKVDNKDVVKKSKDVKNGWDYKDRVSIVAKATKVDDMCPNFLKGV